MGHTEILQPAVVLDRLNAAVKKTLNQDVKDAQTADGMDVALCKINRNNNFKDPNIVAEVQFAGAYRPLYHLNNGQITQYKGNRFPIGGIHNKDSNKFTNHTLKVRKSDSIFFFSDGLPDQFGGKNPEEDQYSPQRIQEIILKNQSLSMDQLAVKLDKDFTRWKADTFQYDDVLMIGIRF